MQKWKKLLILVLAAAVVLTLPVCSLAEEGEVEEQLPDDGNNDEPVQEEPEPTLELTPVPTAEPTLELTPVPTEAPAEQTAEQTAEPTVQPTPQPTEEQGEVNLSLYVLTTSNTPASGYTVRVGGSTQSTNAQGLVQFQGLPVGDNSVEITSPDGQTCSGRLYMSRGGSTVLTDQAMGGTYGLSIARGQRDLYMVVRYEPEGSLLIETLSDVLPDLPEAAAETPVPSEEIRYPAKGVTVTLLTEDGTPVPGIALAIEGNSMSDTVTLDSRGQATVRNMAYGAYGITASMDGTPIGAFSLTINPAQTTAIVSNTAPDIVVNSNVSAQKLFLEFRQSGQTLVLTGASDAPIGGMSSVLLGIIVIAVIIVAAIVLIVIARRRRRAARTPRTRSAVRTNAQIKRRAAMDDDSLYDVGDDGVRRTGGANKFNGDSFDDRSRM